jgi:hypothetical protein
MAQGKVAAALITGMKGAQMGPPIFNVMPRWLLERSCSMSNVLSSPDSVMAAQAIPIEAADRNRWRKNYANFLSNRSV